MGIEPTLSAWEAEVLPLNYTRKLLENHRIVKRRMRIAGAYGTGFVHVRQELRGMGTADYVGSKQKCPV